MGRRGVWWDWGWDEGGSWEGSRGLFVKEVLGILFVFYREKKGDKGAILEGDL